MAGRAAEDEALEVMTNGTRGYPFLIQLVGDRTWRLNPNRTDITVDGRTFRSACPFSPGCTK